MPFLPLLGCAQTAKPLWEPVAPVMVWPPPPETARIQYIGQLTSTQGLHPVKTPWEQFKEGLTGKSTEHRLITPKDIAVNQNRVYVTDPDQNAVLLFDLDRRRTSLITAAGGQPLRAPSHVAAGDQRLYVSDAADKSVAVFDSNGLYLATWGKGEFQRPAGLCWCPADRRLYVADVQAHCLVALDEQGRIARRIGKRGAGPGEFNFPLWVRYDPALGLIVTDTMNARVQRLALDGRCLGVFGSKGDAAGNFSMPKGLAVDTEHHIYVIDNNFENVQIFDGKGRLLLVFGEEGRQRGQFSLPEGICVDAQDRIWVADTFNRRLQVFQFLHAEDKPE